VDIVIKPKNYNEAFHFYSFLPFYGFRQCLLKSEIIFKQDEVLDIRLDISSSYVIAFSYSKEGFEGPVGPTRYSEKFSIQNFQDKKIVEGIKTSKELFRHFTFLLFNKYSLPFLHTVLVIAVALIFYFFHKTGIIFPSFFRADLVETPYCDKKCFVESYSYLFSFAMMVTSSILGIFLCWYLAYIPRG
jgi:hypothetical protein